MCIVYVCNLHDQAQFWVLFWHLFNHPNPLPHTFIHSFICLLQNCEAIRRWFRCNGSARPTQCLLTHNFTSLHSTRCTTTSLHPSIQIISRFNHLVCSHSPVYDRNSVPLANLMDSPYICCRRNSCFPSSSSYFSCSSCSTCCYWLFFMLLLLIYSSPIQLSFEENYCPSLEEAWRTTTSRCWVPTETFLWKFYRSRRFPCFDCRFMPPLLTSSSSLLELPFFSIFSWNHLLFQFWFITRKSLFFQIMDSLPFHQHNSPLRPTLFSTPPPPSLFFGVAIKYLLFGVSLRLFSFSPVNSFVFHGIFPF